MPSAGSSTESRKQRRTFREKILSALTANDFELIGKPMSGNQSQFFSANLAYRSLFTTGYGLRPHIRIEMSFHAPALKPIDRPIQSLIAQAWRHPPEVPNFPCIDPIETAADKLSALAWRVCMRQRGAEDDDPTMIRHLYDLAALESHVAGAEAKEFEALVRETAAADAGRGGTAVPSNPEERFAAMLDLLHGDKLWAAEYDRFVLQVSFAGPGETITFSEALVATGRLLAVVYKKKES
jgi:hypothetical protein